jgi:peroxiredoxin
LTVLTNLVTADNIMANRIEIDASAPDFELADFTGRSVRLSDYRDQRHVVLVFNRGFT